MWVAVVSPQPHVAALQTNLYKPMIGSSKHRFFRNKDWIFTHKLLKIQSRSHHFSEPSTLSVSCSAFSGDSFPQENEELNNVGFILLYLHHFIIFITISFTIIDGFIFFLLGSVKKQDNKGLWQKWKENSAEMSAKLAKLGLAAVLAYGIFDGVTYTSFFIFAFLGYEKSTGNNPAANLQALIGIVILMWTGNNVTRPFRVAGAAALAPIINKGLKRIQKYFNFPTLAYAFALVAGIVAGICTTVVGLLILSRWGK